MYGVFMLPLLLRNAQNMRQGIQVHLADHAGTHYRPDDPIDLMTCYSSAIKSFPTIDCCFMSKADDYRPLLTASAVDETLKRSFRPSQPLSELPVRFDGASPMPAPKL